MENKYRQFLFSPYFFSFVVVLISLLINGYSFKGNVNDQDIYIPIVKNFLNPQLYANDILILTSKDMHSLFFILMGFIGRFINLKTTYFLFHILTLYLSSLSIFFLTFAIFKNKKASILSTLLLIEPKIGLTWHTLGIGYNYFSPPVFAMPLVFLIFKFIFERKYYIAFALNGVLMLFHGLLAIYIFTMNIFILLSRLSKKSISLFIKSVFLFFLFSLPILFTLFKNPDSKPISLFKSVSPLNIFLHFIIRMEAIFPWYSDLMLLSRGIIIILIGLVIFFLAKKEFEERIKKDFYAIFFSVIFMCIMGFIFTEVYPLELVFRFAFWRSTSFISLFSVIIFSYFFVEKWGRADIKEKIVLWSLLIFVFFIEHFYPYWKHILYPLILLSILSAYKWKKIKFINTITGIALIFFVVKIVFLSFKIPYFGEKEIKALLQFGFIVIGILFILIKRENFLKFIFLLFIAGFMTTGSYFNYFKPKNSFEKSWIDTQYWCKKNTPVGTIFIVPPYLTGFRIFSDRGTIGIWNDGHQIAQRSSFSEIWWKRMSNFGYKLKYGRDSLFLGKKIYSNLSVKKIRSIANKYKADYIIREITQKLPLKSIYSNSHFIIYRINS